MKLSACDCRAAYYARAKRSPWMRLAVGRKLYRCHACEALMLLDPAAVQERLQAEAQHDSASNDAFAPTATQQRRA